ncbi:MAG: hypothetical protein HKN10_13185 [Myxococcales bacterium]|nr:hypothetical protein [Myxococcales bacterium]
MRTCALLVAWLAGCSGAPAPVDSVPSDWALVTSSCGYTFMAPPDVVAEDIQGIDSCVDRWSTSDCTVAGDHGVYSGRDIDTGEFIDFRQWSETIDGRTAELTTAWNQLPSVVRRFQSSIYFTLVDSRNPEVMLKVSAFCSTAEAREETLQMFRTINLTEPSAEQR